MLNVMIIELTVTYAIFFIIDNILCNAKVTICLSFKCKYVINRIRMCVYKFMPI